MTKEMSKSAPRRIARLETYIRMPVQETAELAEIVRTAAESCPVHESLREDIEKPVTVQWPEA